MASLYKKVISGKPYWYLREMGWVDGKPKMVSERYVGTAADIEALLDAREERMVPGRTRHLDFGAVAAAWGLLADLGAAAVIDEETGARPPGLPLSPGTYLALELKETGFTASRRLLDVQRISHDPAAGAAALTVLTQPVISLAGTRTAGMPVTSSRVQALLSALRVFRLLPNGFTNPTCAPTSRPCWGSPPRP